MKVRVLHSIEFPSRQALNWDNVG